MARLQGTLDEKEKLTNRVRAANDDAQRDFACGLILSDLFKKDYAQNMVDLQRVNSSIERQFSQIEQHSSLLVQRDGSHSMEQSLDAASDLVRYEAKKLADQSSSDQSDSMFDENNINLITSLVAILQEISKSGLRFLSVLKVYFFY